MGHSTDGHGEAVTGRDVVLGRIRDALTRAPGEPVTVPRDYRRGRTLPDDERRDLFTARLRDYKATVHTCTASETADTVAAALAAMDLGPAPRIAVPPGLDRTWLAATGADVLTDGPDVGYPDLETAHAVVTAAAAGCAETGTIFLDASPDQGRRALTLVPDRHVCVVDLSTVTAGVPEAVAALHPGRPTTLISGPSATSDIELERVEGVHGPRTLAVVLRTDR